MTALVLQPRHLLNLLGLPLTQATLLFLCKLQDDECVENCDDPDPARRRYFTHPMYQLVLMFIGEVMCLAIRRIYTQQATHDSSALLEPQAVSADDDHVVVKPEKSHSMLSAEDPLAGWRVLRTGIPAFLDLLASAFVFSSLLFVDASIVQMSAGITIFLVAILSSLFLGQYYVPYKWACILAAFLSIVLVGLSTVHEGSDDALSRPATPSSDHVRAYGWDSLQVFSSPKAPPALILLGLFLLLLGNMARASQAVVEQYFYSGSELSSLDIVGLEGTAGLSMLTVLLGVAYACYGSTEAGRGGIFDMVDCWHVVTSNRYLVVSSVASLFIYAVLNLTALGITRSLGGTTRVNAELCTTLLAWCVSLAIGWEPFRWLQLIGFSIFVYATLVLHDIIPPPSFAKAKSLDVASVESGRATGDDENETDVNERTRLLSS